MSVVKGRIMEAIPDGFVFVEIHMRPAVLAELRTAALHAGMPVEDWLVRLLRIGVIHELAGRRV
jgi:hypothetical protein